MKNTYVTKTIAYNLDEENPIIGIEVPEGFLVDLDLKINEVLEWVIDTESKTATITKKNIIINT